MKIQDLFEAAVGKSPTLTLLNDKEKIIEYIKSNCSNMITNIKTGKVYWRADYHFEKALEDNGLGLTVDPSLTIRQSENTTNQYTEILDNHPKMAKYPKRSRSYICATDKSIAEEFGEVFVIIPSNGTKIGFTNQGDIWNTPLNLFGYGWSFEGVNSIFNDLKLYNWKDIVKFDADLKGENKAAILKLQKYEKSLIEEYEIPTTILKHKDNFLKTILAAFAPEKLGFKVGKAGDWIHDQEIWIGGPCLVLTEAIYKEIKAELK